MKFAHRFQHCGLPIVDLIHAGNVGLVEAARRFHTSRRASFISYASWWVRQAMVHAISDRANAPLLTPSVVTTPASDPLPPALPADMELDDEAERLALELDDEGIECFLDGENQASFTGILNINVLVRASDEERARQLLNSHASKD